MKVSDFYENGRRRWFRLLEKGGKHHEVPVHHKAQDYVAEYLETMASREQFVPFDQKCTTDFAVRHQGYYRFLKEAPDVRKSEGKAVDDSVIKLFLGRQIVGNVGRFLAGSGIPADSELEDILLDKALG